MLIDLLTRYYKSIKGVDLELDRNFRSAELFCILFPYSLALIRGVLFYLTKFSWPKLLFIGRNFRTRYKLGIEFGRGVKIGDNCFIDAVAFKKIAIGDGSSLGNNVEIICTAVLNHKGQGLTIGNYVGLNNNCVLHCQGGLSIGDNSILGPNVFISSENHGFDGVKLIREQNVIRKPVFIGRNCWLGANVTVLSGVAICDNAVIAAGAVVTKNIEKAGVYIGSPARLFRAFE